MFASRGNKTPTVSILLNNYNYAQFLEESILSALNQTYENCEVIVIDDGSKDDSPSIIQKYSSHIQFSLKDNAGQASAFNAGFSLSTGDIICFLDSDDYFYPDKIDRIVSLFSENPLVGWIFHQLEYVDAQGEPHDRVDKSSSTHSKHLDFREKLKLGIPPKEHIPCGLCFRRSTLAKILPMPVSNGVSISDNYIKYAAIALSPGLLLNSKLAVQRIHSSNTYTSRKNNQALRAEIHIKTGYYLQERFPEIGLFADKIFVKGLAEMLSMFLLREIFSMEEVAQHLSRNVYPKFVVINVLKCTFHMFRFSYLRFKSQLFQC